MNVIKVAQFERMVKKLIKTTCCIYLLIVRGASLFWV